MTAHLCHVSQPGCNVIIYSTKDIGHGGIKLIRKLTIDIEWKLIERGSGFCRLYHLPPSPSHPPHLAILPYQKSNYTWLLKSSFTFVALNRLNIIMCTILIECNERPGFHAVFDPIESFQYETEKKVCLPWISKRRSIKVKGKKSPINIIQ